MNIISDIIAYAIITVVTIALFAISAFLFAIDFSYFWYWFIVPVFHLSPIGLAQSYGISFFTGLVLSGTIIRLNYISNVVSSVEDKKNEFFSTIKSTLIFYPVLFIMGWIFHAVFL